MSRDSREPEQSFDHELAQAMMETLPRFIRWMRTEMRATAKPQLTVAQLRILAKLYRGGSTITELSEWQGVSAPAMSKMVGILESRGLAKRNSQTEDRRQVLVTHTEEGRRTFLAIRKVVRAKIADKLSSLPEQKKKVLFEAVQTMGEIYV